MNHVMRELTCCDEESWVKSDLRAFQKILNGDWIDVMNDNLVEQYKSWNPQIACTVSGDYAIPNSLPFP